MGYALTASAPAREVVAVLATGVVEAVGIEATAAQLIQTILERFRGRVTPTTRPKSATETR